jgi:uncharacterized protein involved in type VI secretion and phage assembly
VELGLRLHLTHRDDPGAYAFESAAQGQRLARNQLQALNLRQQCCTGAGTLRSAAPGSTIVLNGQHAPVSGLKVAYSFSFEQMNSFRLAVMIIALGRGIQDWCGANIRLG